MYRKLASAVLVAAAINAKYAVALGLGEMTMHSALNQPLNAEIKLTNVGDLDETQILVNLAAESAFKNANVDRTYFLTGMKFEVVLDRHEAIRKGLQLCGRKDILLVAGKGHETYQEIKGAVIPFDDREVVREIAG